MDKKEIKTRIPGRVVEIFRVEKKNIAKVQFEPSYIDIDIENIEDIHLGDAVDIFCKYTVLRIEPMYGIRKPENLH